MKIRDKTSRELCALSGNVCAFPDCNQQIFDRNHNLIGQVCHIEAANPGGERYNADQTDEERASIDNLLLLCANHHLVTNNVSIYTVENLKAMKKSHEENYKDHPYPIDKNELSQISLTLSSMDQRIADISKSIEDRQTSNTRNRYEMQVEFGMVVGPNGVLLLALTGMNTGESPITLSHWGLELPDTTYIPGYPNLFPFPVQFPYKLLPGESVTVAMEKSIIESYLKRAGYPNTTRLLGFFKDQLKNKYEKMSEQSIEIF